MSKIYDERVVSMKFDNSNFEKNVHQSLGTLDKLKKALNFEGAAKGMEELADTASKMDMGVLAKSVDTVSKKFTSMEVVAITALSNITNKAVDAGEQLVKSLTIDQLTAGWSKYEQKISSVQTIMAATTDTWEANAKALGFAGTQMEFVSAQLDKLNWFSDETSYSFTDMTSNIGKFTSAGIDLDKSVEAMEGISVWAAKSGQNAQSAARAYYNLAQAISVGSVKLIDWKSIENANMATMEFKETAIKTAEALGTLKKSGKGVWTAVSGDQGEVSITDFNSALKDGWFTSEVLMETLKEYGKTATMLADIYERYGVETTPFLNALDDFNSGNRNLTKISEDLGMSVEELLPLFEKLNSEEYKLSLSAFRAAQEAKTFTEVIEATKDAVSTGWMNTWELLFGNYEQAKKLWSHMAEDFYDIFVSGGEERNDLLKGALGSAWDLLTSKINEAGIATEDFEKMLVANMRAGGTPIDHLLEKWGSLEQVFKNNSHLVHYIKDTILNITQPVTSVTSGINNTVLALEEYQKVVNGIIRGNFKSGATRVKKLTEAGYDYATMQGLVNKVWERNGHNWKNTTITMDDVLDVLKKLNKEELANIGLTIEDVESLEALQKEFGTLGSDAEKLLARLTKRSGRELIFDSILHVVSAIKKMVGAVKKAWRDVFPQKTTEEVYDFLDAIEKITAFLDANEETFDKISRTLRGVFSISGMIRDIIAAALRVFLPDLISATGEVGDSLLDVTAAIGDVIFNFRQMVKDSGLVQDIMQYLKDMFYEGIKVISEFSTYFADIPIIGDILRVMADSLEKIKDFFKELWKIFYDSIIDDQVSVFEAVVRVFERLDVAFSHLEEEYPVLKDIREALEKFFHTFKDSGEDILSGLIEGLTNIKLEDVKKAVTDLAELVYNTFADWMGIHSPATKFISLALNCIAGLIVGFIEGAIYVYRAIRDFAKGIGDETDTYMNDNPDSPMAKLRNYMVLMLLGIKDTFIKILDNVKTVISAISGYLSEHNIFGRMISIAKTLLGMLYLISLIQLNIGMAISIVNFSKAAKAIGSFFRSWALKNYAQIARNLAITISVLSVVVYLLASLPAEKFEQAKTAMWGLAGLTVVLGIVMGALNGLSAYLSNIRKEKITKDDKGTIGTIMQIAFLIGAIGAAVFLIIQAVDMVKNMISNGVNTFETSFAIVLGVAFGLFAIAGALSKFASSSASVTNLIGVAAIIGVIGLCIGSIFNTIYKYFYKKDQNGNVAINIMDNLSNFIGAIIGIITLIGAMSAGAGLISAMSNGSAFIIGLAGTVIGISVAILIIIQALKDLYDVLKEIQNDNLFISTDSEGKVKKSGWAKVLVTIVTILGIVVGFMALIFSGLAVLIGMIKNNPSAGLGLIAAALFLVSFQVAILNIVNCIKTMDTILSKAKNPTESLVAVIGIMGIIFGGATLLSHFNAKGAAWTFAGVAVVIGVFAYALYELANVKDVDKVANLVQPFASAIQAILAIVGLFAFLIEVTDRIAGGDARNFWNTNHSYLEGIIGAAGLMFILGETLIKLSDIPWSTLEPMMDKLNSVLSTLIGVSAMASIAQEVVKSRFGLANDFSIAAVIGAMGIAFGILAQGLVAILDALKNDENWQAKIITVAVVIGVLIGVLTGLVVLLALFSKECGESYVMIAIVVFALGYFINAIANLMNAITYFVENETLSKAFEKMFGWIVDIISKVKELIDWLGNLFSIGGNSMTFEYVDPVTGETMTKTITKQEVKNAIKEYEKESKISKEPDDTIIARKKALHEYYDDLYGGNDTREEFDETKKGYELMKYYSEGPNRAIKTIENEASSSIGNAIGEAVGKAIDDKLNKAKENPLEVAAGADKYIGSVGMYGIRKKGSILELPEKLADLETTYNNITGALGSDTAKKLLSGEKINMYDLMTEAMKSSDMSDETKGYMAMIFGQNGEVSADAFGEAYNQQFQEYMNSDEVKSMYDDMYSEWGEYYGNLYSQYFSEGTTGDMTGVPNYDLFGSYGMGGLGTQTVEFPEKMTVDPSTEFVKLLNANNVAMQRTVENLGKRIQGLYVMLDSRVLVGELTPSINVELNRLNAGSMRFQHN